jgi:tripartite-type tricarboxylate transporter receptor subunit TctC
MNRFARLLAACLVVAGWASAAAAETYPVRRVTMINPFPPGSPVDVVARMTAEELQKEFGQPFIVDNRAGAGGVIGANVVARARPDGYTLLLTSASTQIIAPVLRAEMPYDTIRDFRPVSLIAWGPTLVVVHPSLPVRSLQELVAYARANPEAVAYGSSGTGTILHLSGELFQERTGTRLLHVPFSGAAPAATALLGGQVLLMFDSINNAMNQVRAGQLRGLAVLTRERFAGLPDVPTAAEAGMTDLEFPAWIGLLAPAGTPDDVVQALERAVRQRLGAPAVAERLRAAGLFPELSTSADFAAALPRQIALIERIAAAARIPKQ